MHEYAAFNMKCYVKELQPATEASGVLNNAFWMAGSKEELNVS
jgi:hypothetical protein